MRTLESGGNITLRQSVPVNIVLVGYHRSAVGVGLRSQLPSASTPVVRVPLLYGLNGRPLGLRFRYRYNVVEAPDGFDNAFFRHLRGTGTSTPLTTFQAQYNAQKANVLDVTPQILTLDAASTERYLESQAAQHLGVTSKSYTVFLINWWGRKDFRFHVYRKTDTVDPDTHANFGTHDSRAMIAWGGSSGRSWFYDLSAGPEAWTSNWDVDDADADGDGVADYRMPPVWEYAHGGYHAPSTLPSDLGKIVRYVALDCLFTSSPLYDPLGVAPSLGGAQHVHVTMNEGDPASTGSSRIQPQSSVAEWKQLEPYIRWRADVRDVRPTPDPVVRSLSIWADLVKAPGCWKPFGTTFAQLFCFARNHRRAYIPPSGRDHVEPFIAYNTTDAQMGDELPLLGYADDNWVDGRQSYVYAFDYPDAWNAGFGFTTTLTHEVGHHLGMSHPHDGYDASSVVDFAPVGKTYYSWVGDESNTVMSYNAVSNVFGVFDKDNMSRYQTAGYLNWADALLGAIDRASLTPRDRTRLGAADADATAAVAQFRSWRYLSAAADAYRAWALVATVAQHQGVAERAQPFSRSVHRDASLNRPEPDPIRFPTS